MTSYGFFGIFDLPTYPNQILYYISLFSKIRCSLTYLPTQISDVIYECSHNEMRFFVTSWTPVYVDNSFHLTPYKNAVVTQVD